MFAKAASIYDVGALAVCEDDCPVFSFACQEQAF